MIAHKKIVPHPKTLVNCFSKIICENPKFATANNLVLSTKVALYAR